MEDRILETHVIKWMKSVEVIDANKNRFEAQELQAYTTARNIFSKNRPNVELLSNSCETLREYLDGGVKDEVFTAVRDFLKTTDIAKDNFQAFKELLEDREFFGSPVAASEGVDFQGSSMGTATYRRVEIDGDVYEGMFLGNERVWKGKINYADGSCYEGEWGNDGPHGEGVLTWDDGTKFIGRFAGLSGNGKIEYVDGDYYEGPWNEYGANGRGVFHFDGRVDRGEYADGARVGTGRMEWDNGDWYEGEWNENGAHGQGVMRIGDRIDRGQYAESCRVGSGRMEWDNGDWYEGGWNDNGQHGKGTLYVASCNRTDMGDWQNGEATGNVLMKWKNGDTYKGTWSRNSNGDLNGVGEYYTASSSKTRSGKWVNGKWENDWATTRNVIGAVLMGVGVISIFAGSWITGIVITIVGKFVYEGK